jgi:ABC-type multidrug transport system fused ATPase/permease subunit
VWWLSALAVIAAAFDVVIPILYGRALDAVVGQRPLQVLARFLAMWLALRFVADWFRRIIVFTGYRIAHAVGMEFNRTTFSHLIALPLSFHHEQKRGEIQERVNRVRNGLDNVLSQGVFDFLPNAVAVIGATAYLITLDPALAAVHAVVVVAYCWRTIRLVPALDAAWETHVAAERKLYGRLSDALQNVTAVKASTAEPFEEAVARERTESMYATELAKHVVLRQQAADQHIIFGVGTAVLFGVAAFDVARGVLTPGAVATVLGYAFLTWGMIRFFVWTWWECIALNTYRRAYAEIAGIAEEAFGVGRTVALRGAVEFRNVQFRYREDTPVLEDITFRVEAGQTVAIVGESGEGKTTIVELLSRYYEPRAGVITVDDVPLNEIELGSLRSQLAYVPQDLTLFHDSIRENIRYGRLDASDAEVEEAAWSAALHGWIMELPDGYATIVGERGLKLSAGQRQRVAIARAFLRKPKILILDEPTSQLDAATEDVIQRSLRLLMRKRTTFVIAHRLRTVQDADRILVLKDGRIVEYGTHAQLMERGGEYRRLRAFQFAEAEQ